MPKRQKPMNGHSSEERVMQLRLSAQANKGLSRVHRWQLKKEGKTEFEVPKSDTIVPIKLRLPLSVDKELVELQARRSAEKKRWISRNRLIEEIITERVEKTQQWIREALSEGKDREAIRAELGERLYTHAPGDKLSRHSMIIKMIQDAAQEER